MYLKLFLKTTLITLFATICLIIVLFTIHKTIIQPSYEKHLAQEMQAINRTYSQLKGTEWENVAIDPRQHNLSLIFSLIQAIILLSAPLWLFIYFYIKFIHKLHIKDSSKILVSVFIFITTTTISLSISTLFWILNFI